MSETTQVEAVPVAKEVNHRTDILKRIRSRRRKLQKVSKELKANFVGLDHIIDEIIRNIEVWYVMPEVISRPVIINLWGMTGVGKTDLVRKLVKGLEFTDKFLEIQLTNNGSSTGGYHTTVNGTLSCSNLETKSPGVLLLDEIQRFRSISDEGKEIMDYKFQDVWMLLSDGRFGGSTEKEDIMRVIFEHVYWSVPAEEKKKSEDSPEVTEIDIEKVKKQRYRQSYYSAKFLRRALRLQTPIEEIMMWDNEKKIQVAFERMEDQSTYEGDDYSKLLIFISGNLDEAYRMSGDVSDANRDADVLHAFSQKINLITIKNALQKRFKPEQISRFGNTHIIYPSLSKNSYARIIAMRIGAIVDRMKDEHNISIDIDQSVYDFVYRNGVFPTQGVRPLFSTISSYIENAMPTYILAAIEKNCNEIKLKWENQELVATQTDGTLLIKTKCEGVIDEIKDSNDHQKRVQVSVHEACHAILYADLFKVIPTQIVSNTSSETSGGFISVHTLCPSKQAVLDLVAVYMAGAVGEEMVFGHENLTSGASGDIQLATQYITQAVREWGMFEQSSHIEHPQWPGGRYANNNNSDAINNQVDKIIHGERTRAREIIERYIPLLHTVSSQLIQDGKMEPEEFHKLCKNYGISARIQDAKATLYANFQDRYKAFFGSQMKISA